MERERAIEMKKGILQRYHHNMDTDPDDNMKACASLSDQRPHAQLHGFCLRFEASRVTDGKLVTVDTPLHGGGAQFRGCSVDICPKQEREGGALERKVEGCDYQGD